MQLGETSATSADRRVLIAVVRDRLPEGDGVAVDGDRLVNVERTDGRIVQEASQRATATERRQVQVGVLT